MDFKVKYTVVPFTIVEQYTPNDANVNGWYTKNAKMPGGDLLSLPTVVVDATSSSDGLYDTMTLYSCLDPLHAVQVTELIFATRSKDLDKATLEKMKSVARGLGVTWKDSDLTVTDQSKC